MRARILTLFRGGADPKRVSSPTLLATFSTQVILEIELLRFNEMPQPSFEDLDPVLRAGASRVAQRLHAAGEEAWLVGGAVRNLSLGLPAADADLATGALPDRVLELFPRSLSVGKAFGTIVVRLGEESWIAAETSRDPALSPQQIAELGKLDIEVTTFRSEEGYSDGRRPDEVSFGADAGEDAERRDFTCNALFLEVLTGRLFDPTGGLADLEAGRLRCVGDPLGRFSEDGLRLLRLARFHARYGLEVERETMEAARACRDKLSGVSSERRLQELKKLFSHPGSARGVALLDKIGLWPQVFEGSGLAITDSSSVDLSEAFGQFTDPPGESLGLTALLTQVTGDLPPEAYEAAVLALHGPRAVGREIAEILRTADRLLLVIEGKLDIEDLAVRTRLLREPTLPLARQLVLARHRALLREDFGAIMRMGQMEAAQAVAEADELWPEPFLNGKDLLDAGIPPGPAIGEILLELEDHQLRRELTSREAALRWLDELSEDYDGGKTFRSE